MSFLIGPITGGVVAGAVYYSFSQSFETRTRTLQKRLHDLSVELEDPTVPAPPPASQRIIYSPFRELLKERWNEELAHAVRAVGTFEVDWRSMWERANETVSRLTSST